LVDSALRVPLVLTTAKVMLETGRGLIAVFCPLREQLHDDCRHRSGDFVSPLEWRYRTPREMAVHPLHRFFGGEPEVTGKHLVEHDAESVEIGAGIDRAIHPPRLFWRHVGERAGKGLRLDGRLTLTRETRRQAESGQVHRVGCVVDENMDGLDVLVNE